MDREKDVPDRKLSKEERDVGQLPGFTQFAIDHLADAAYWITEDASIVYVNHTACRMLGYTREELLKLRIYEVNPDAALETWPNVWRLLKQGGNRTFEVTHRTKDGRLLPVEIAANFFEFEGVEYSCAFVRDITARKQLEQRLLQSEKMRAIGQLAGGVAHDFNNQLTGIAGYADLLEDQFKEGSEGRDFLAQIQLGVKRSADLTSQLLAFSRQGNYRSETVDLNGIVEEVVGILQRSIEKKIELVSSPSASSAFIKGDPTQIQSAVLNLALNARDAMPAGGQLSLRVQMLRLEEVTCISMGLDYSPDGFVVVVVEDTGIGMTPEVTGRVFEPFFTTKPKGAGTGLGLAAVYGTAKSHGGNVVIESEPDKGTSVSMYFPRHETDEPTPQAKSPANSTLLLDATIMVVEDEVPLLKMVTLLLKKMGCQVFSFENGEEAISFFKRSPLPIDLVLLDMCMPGMDGRDTYLAMREHKVDVKVLLASGYSLEGEASRLVEEGVLGFLQKPYRKNLLNKKIREILYDDEMTDSEET